MDLKTVVFIDGQNFKKNLQEFEFHSSLPGSRYQTYRLDEKHFEWKEFFLAVIDRFNMNTHLSHRLVRAYWYNAETMTPFSKNPKWIQRIIEDNPDIPELNGELVERLALEWWERERDHFLNTRSTFFEEIQRKTDFLEFKYVGQYVVRPFDPHRIFKQQNGEIVYQGKRLTEKGVDIGIAVDMISKIDQYDAGILVSGDADYMPAVLYIKDRLKQFYQFSLAKGIPPRIRHLSPWLRGVVDSFQFFDEYELLTRFLDRGASIPPYILEAIDRRIDELTPRT